MRCYQFHRLTVFIHSNYRMHYQFCVHFVSITLRMLITFYSSGYLTSFIYPWNTNEKESILIIIILHVVSEHPLAIMVQENLTLLYIWNKKCTDQPAHQRSLISALVVHSIYNKHAKGQIWIVKLVSVVEQADLRPHRRHCVVVVEQDTFILA